MPFDQWKRRIESLGGVMFQRRCSCPAEPVHVEPGDPDVVISPVIRDLPCPVCKGLRDVEYVLRVIRTELTPQSCD
jgi:hypothetical protein